MTLSRLYLLEPIRILAVGLSREGLQGMNLPRRHFVDTCHRDRRWLRVEAGRSSSRLVLFSTRRFPIGRSCGPENSRKSARCMRRDFVTARELREQSVPVVTAQILDSQNVHERSVLTCDTTHGLQCPAHRNARMDSRRNRPIPRRQSVQVDQARLGRWEFRNRRAAFLVPCDSAEDSLA